MVLGQGDDGGGRGTGRRRQFLYVAENLTPVFISDVTWIILGPNSKEFPRNFYSNQSGWGSPYSKTKGTGKRAILKVTLLPFLKDKGQLPPVFCKSKIPNKFLWWLQFCSLLCYLLSASLTSVTRWLEFGFSNTRLPQATHLQQMT